MPELIVISKIDGNPVAWRCSNCRQTFSIPGKLTTEERRKKATEEFRSHLRLAHAPEEAAHRPELSARESSRQ
jgi:hypothetical protein